MTEAFTSNQQVNLRQLVPVYEWRTDGSGPRLHRLRDIDVTQGQLWIKSEDVAALLARLAVETPDDAKATYFRWGQALAQLTNGYKYPTEVCAIAREALGLSEKTSAECAQRDVREVVPAASLPPELQEAAKQFATAFGRHEHRFEGEPIGLCSCGARLVPKEWSIAMELGQPCTCVSNVQIVTCQKQCDRPNVRPAGTRPARHITAEERAALDRAFDASVTDVSETND